MKPVKELNEKLSILLADGIITSWDLRQYSFIKSIPIERKANLLHRINYSDSIEMALQHKVL